MFSNRIHIVIVDDNLVNLDLAESVLKDHYKLTKLISGAQLLKMLQRVIPDMILLDIQMPEMSGYGVLEKIKENPAWCTIPVIFLSAQKDIESEREGFRLGARDFISKPFDTVVMRARIQSQLELQQYRLQLEDVINIKTKAIEDLQHVITVGWAEIIESRDGTTGAHVRNTTRYYEEFLAILAEREFMGNVLVPEFRADLIRASALHDIGKIGISDVVLKKPASLTSEEFDMMKKHANIGADMIQKIIDDTSNDHFLLLAKEMALSHHERWDGTGYPNGLHENEIPFYVQILTMVDVFDALTSVRPYKHAFSLEVALDIMKKERGQFYNPELLDIFLENASMLESVLLSKV